MIKRKYRCTKLSSLTEVVEGSTSGGQNRAFVVGAENPSNPLVYYDWATSISSIFTPVQHITSYHHFRCMDTDLGSVFVREFADSEEKKVVVRQNAAFDKTRLPSILTPPGLSEERKQYLFQQIRPYCDEEYRDITCPQPRAQKRTVQQGSDLQSNLNVCVPIAECPVIPKPRKGYLHVLSS